MNDYEAVIGLEVHVQLDTESKIFCSCPNTFGAEPNSLICPVCTGMPGVLPVLNKKALNLGLRVALALNCQIQQTVFFERKHYFYPDLPKGYQISQYVQPLGKKGFLAVEGTNVGINRVHLEEDAGKLIHKEDCSLVDLNRAGVPLIEIVSEPDLRSPEQAYRYLTELKLVLEYIQASTCDMEKGFLRCDANVSVRKSGDRDLGVKAELKNMNSFRQVRAALEYEVVRQTKLVKEHRPVLLQTRLWEESARRTKAMRTKEEAHDYRYFPEPDLVVYHISDKDKEAEQNHIGELPAQKRRRFKDKFNLDPKYADIMLSEAALSRFFEDCAGKYADIQKIINWIIGPLRKILNERSLQFSQVRISSDNFIKLVKLTDEGKITNLIAKKILQEIIDTDKDPEEIIKSRNLVSLSDTTELTSMVQQAIQQNPKAVADFKSGKQQAVMFLVGQVMKQTKGKANPGRLRDIFITEINKG